MEEPPRKLVRLGESEYTLSFPSEEPFTESSDIYDCVSQKEEIIESGEDGTVLDIYNSTSQTEEVIESGHMEDETVLDMGIEQSRELEFELGNITCDKSSLVNPSETIVYIHREGPKEFKEPPNIDIPVLLVTDDQTLELTKIDHSYQKAERSPFMGRSRRHSIKSLYSCRHCKEEGVSNEHFKAKAHLDHISNCHEPLKCLSKAKEFIENSRKVDLIRGTVLEGGGKTEVANYVVDQNETSQNEISVQEMVSDKIVQETILKEDGRKIIRATLPEKDQVEKSEWFENRNLYCYSEEVNPWPTEIHHTLGNNVSSIQTMVNLVQDKIEKKQKKKAMMPSPAQGLTIDGKPIVYRENGVTSDTKVIEVRVQPFPFNCYKEMALLCLLDAQAQISEETLAAGAKPGMTVSAMAKWVIENLNIRVSEESMGRFILRDLQQLNSIFKSQPCDGEELVWTVDWESRKPGASRKNILVKHLEQIKRTISTKADLINDHIKTISLKFYGM